MVEIESRNARRGHATFIGRIGALAATLGVGVAIATGQGVGVAHAEDTDTTTNNTADAGADPDAGPGTDESNDPPATQPDEGADHSTPASASGPASVPQMRLRSSGGALFSDRWQRRDTQRWRTVLESPKHKLNRSAELPQPEAKRSADPSESPTNQRHSRRVDAPVRAFASTFNEPRHARMTAADTFPPPERSSQETLPALNPPKARHRIAITLGDPDPGVVQRNASTVTRPATVLERASTLLATALSPFLTPRPTAPPQPPVLLAVLGWIRREIEHTFFNRTPVARDVAIAAHSQTPSTFDVIRVADDDPVTYSVPERGQYGGPQSGTVAIDRSTGEFAYTPDTGVQVGTEDEFTVTVSDEAAGFHVHGLSGLLRPDRGHTTTVKVSVTVVNSAPTAPDITVDTTVDKPIDIDLLRDLVSDPDGDPLTIQSITVNATPNQGPFTITYVPGLDPGDIVVRTDNADLYVPDGTELGVFTYTPRNRGVDTITYVVSDGVVERTGTIIVNVGAATDVTYDLEVGESEAVDLFRLVTMPDGDPSSVTHVRFSDGQNIIELSPPLELDRVQTDHATYAYPDRANQAVFTATAVNGGVDTITYTVHQGDSQITGTITIKVIGTVV